ncbi:hypothetical protein L484_004447 [Morus notabilis]|uniref:Uncharacterized protein n=1 Tax=Morus notabilis TaxID=981085 RepID=W9RWE5_9ROSA|nr:hypothetical protein L484_004447 [Morus notabilis]
MQQFFYQSSIAFEEKNGDSFEIGDFEIFSVIVTVRSFANAILQFALVTIAPFAATRIPIGLSSPSLTKKLRTPVCTKV